MTFDREKTRKILAVALNTAATDGEWNAAAIAFIACLRRAGITVDNMMPPDDQPPALDRMPFGRYKGRLFITIPTNYLRWVLENIENLSPELRDRMNFEIQNRN